MNVAPEIKALFGNLDQRIEFVNEVLRLKKSTKKFKLIEAELIHLISTKNISLTIKNTTFYLLGKLKSEKAIPAISKSFLATPYSIGLNLGYLNFDAVTALQAIGIKSKKAILKLLDKADDYPKLNALTLALFNLIKDNKKVEAILKKKKQKRNTKESKLFNLVLKDLKKWRFDEEFK